MSNDRFHKKAMPCVDHFLVSSPILSFHSFTQQTSTNCRLVPGAVLGGPHPVGLLEALWSNLKFYWAYSSNNCGPL